MTDRGWDFKLWWVLAAGVGLACGQSVAHPVEPAEFLSRLESQAQRGRDEYRVPGVALAVVHRGRIVLAQGFGVADQDSGRAVSADTVFQVASVSKSVTAWGVLGLVAQGRLDLDTPVQELLTRWRLPPSSFDADQVTLRRLLSHTAGLGVHGYPGFSPERTGAALVDVLAGTSESPYGPGGGVRMQRPPGTFQYSGGGYTVLQLVVEEATGEPFAEYMQRAVFEPLAMSRSSFRWTPTVEDQLATPYSWNQARLPSYRFTAQAAGGLYSTVLDLARFVIGLQEVPAPDSTRPAAETSPFLPQDGTRGAYGLGFALERTPEGAVMASHQGANRGWRSLMAALPGQGDGLVVLSNSDRALPLIMDLFCSWGAWTTGSELASCWAEGRRRGTVRAVAGLAGLGLLLNGSWFFIALVGARRVPFWRLPPRSQLWSLVKVSFPVGVICLWWLFWYTDEVVLRREGVGNFTPVASMPPTFFWLSLAVFAWCLLGVARALLPLRARVRTQARRDPSRGGPGTVSLLSN